MIEILLCNQSLSPKSFQSQCGISIDQISTFNYEKPTVAAANTPYIISDDNAGSNRSILCQLSPKPVAKELTNLSLSYGGDNVVALAELQQNSKITILALWGLQ